MTDRTQPPSNELLSEPQDRVDVSDFVDGIISHTDIYSEDFSELLTVDEDEAQRLYELFQKGS